MSREVLEMSKILHSPRRGRHVRTRVRCKPSRAVLTRVTALVVGAAAAGLALPAASVNAMAKIKCKTVVGYSVADPIVHHDQPATGGHQHTFFGNTALLRLAHPDYATYASLVGHGTNCENPDDSAAYWQPTLRYISGSHKGQPVRVLSFTAYYRSYDHKETGVAAPIPADTRLVAGSPTATGYQPTSRVNWSCGQYSSIGATPYIPDCAKATGKVVQLTAHITFPSCWDGRHARHDIAGDTRDNAHWRYAVKGVCPSGFGHRMAELRETIRFDYAGTGSDVALSSDQMARAMGRTVRNGQTLHADFWNTWRQTGGTYGGMTGMVHDCITTTGGSAAECG
jgi:hypothetical protein